MTDPAWSPLPPRYDETLMALHTMAEHILAAARYRVERRIGLQPVRDGFGTPLINGQWIEIVGTDLVVRNETGEVVREPVTTLRNAGTILGMEPGLPEGIYEPATPLELDAGLEVDPDAARAIAEWFRLTSEALGQFTGAHRDASANGPTLWPEHFDLALTMDGVNYGGSPGDADHAGPYLYVGPATLPPPPGAFWNESFGAGRPGSSIVSVSDAVAFFEQGRSEITTASR